MTDMMKRALAYATLGQPVFPCYESGAKAKSPRTKHGYLDATTDTSQIKDWWTRYPNAAVGLPTGIYFNVIDVDIKSGIDGEKVFDQLATSNDALNKLLITAVHTPSGGSHWYYRADSAKPVSNLSFRSLGIDIRGTGGYVIAYADWQWENVGERQALDFKPLIQRLRIMQDSTRPKHDGTTSKGKGAVYPEGIVMTLLDTKEGERNSRLFWSACRFYESGLDVEPLIYAGLAIGLEEDEIRLALGSAKRTVRANDNHGDA